MYRLLIIEDEPIEREALKLMIQNNCDEKFEVETAENGFQAVDILDTWIPDVAMVDINMPGMNGLDTIRAMKKKNANLRFLILSSYNRFEYAQEALKLGVEDFILKPAKIDHLKESLLAIVEKIETEQKNHKDNSMLLNRMEEIRPVVESDCIYALISGKSVEDIQNSIRFLGYEVESGFCFVVDFKERPRFILHKIKQSLIDIGMKCIGEQFHNMLVFFLISEKVLEERKTREVANFVTMLLKEMGVGGTCMGVGKIQMEVQDLSISYRQALTALKQGGVSEQRVAVYESQGDGREQQEEKMSAQAGRLMEAIRKTDEKVLEEELSCLGTEFIMKAETFPQARNYVYQILLLLFERMKENDAALGNLLDLNLSIEEVLNISSRKELELYAVLQIKRLMKVMIQYRKINTNLLIEEALRYLETHYGGNLMLDEIAAHLEVSPFYLSKLFKKSTGKNFTDLLAEKRIEKAKDLLRTPMSIKEVTFAVGFNSQNYFTKIFKKYIGVTPKEYKHKGDGGYDKRD